MRRNKRGVLSNSQLDKLSKAYRLMAILGGDLDPLPYRKKTASKVERLITGVLEEHAKVMRSDARG